MRYKFWFRTVLFSCQHKPRFTSVRAGFRLAVCKAAECLCTGDSGNVHVKNCFFGALSAARINAIMCVLEIHAH